MKKENNKKIYIIFACSMLGCFVIGFFIGGLFSKFSDAIKNIDWTAVAKAIVIPANVLFVLMKVVANVISLFLYIRAKKKYQNLSEMEWNSLAHFVHQHVRQGKCKENGVDKSIFLI